MRVDVLQQRRVWVDAAGKAHKLRKMDPHYRANLIPFLRGNCRTLYAAAHGINTVCLDCVGHGLVVFEYDYDQGGPIEDYAVCQQCDGSGRRLPDHLVAEEWLEQTPLMRRLVELEQGRTIDERRATHERNLTHERATGYRKVRLG